MPVTISKLNYFVIFTCILLQQDGVSSQTQRDCSYQQKYYTNCGFLGLGRCTRHRTIHLCCTGWSGGDCNTPQCNQVLGFCKNSGVCTAGGSCQCQKQYHGTECESRCPDIAHCEFQGAPEERCVLESTTWNSVCDRCDGDYGILGQAYARAADQKSCIKQCSWRSDSNACFPGSCTQGSCTCETGFSGLHCLNMAHKPNILSYKATITMGSTTTESPPTAPITGDTSYINLQGTNQVNVAVYIKTNFQWEIPETVNNNIPPYLDSTSPFVLGVTNVAINIDVEAKSSEDECAGQTPTWSATSQVTDGGSVGIKTDAYENTYTLAVDSSAFSSNTRLKVTWTSTSGGEMKLLNRDSNNAPFSLSYTGSPESRSSYLRIDNEPPYHCTGTTACQNSMLRATPHMSSGDGMITVDWSDWKDHVSCTVNGDKYSLFVYHLQYDSVADELYEVLTAANTVYGMHDLQQAQVTVSLPQGAAFAGVYSFVLTSLDFAGNPKLSRRFVFHDTGTAITKTANIVKVTSASEPANFEWITQLAVTGQTKVDIEWTGHFINQDHVTHGLLSAIRNFNHPVVEEDYDQTFGTRGKAAIPNIQGITKLELTYNIDTTTGCRNAVASKTWQDLGIATSQSYDLTIADGNAICVWVKAYDVFEHSNQTPLIVHVDSSPPVISYLYLVRDGEINLAVHSTTQFLDMSAVFEAFDEHSGLNHVEWELYDNFGGTKVPHGSGTLPVIQAGCDATCICIPNGDCYRKDFTIVFDEGLGNHDHDYFITVTVKNNAELTTSKTLKITIDTSPPLSGVVHDGMPGFPDVDFQQSLQITAHWDGFFDKESGVKFYEYVFGTECWNGDPSSSATRTLLPRSAVQWTAPSAGRYYASVVAYNRALEPSKIVCSDGVTIDDTPPVVLALDMKEARVKPGLVKDTTTQEVWFVDKHRARCKVNTQKYDADCLNQALTTDDINLFPLQADLTDSMCPTEISCNPLSERIFLPKDKHILVNWKGSDEESLISKYVIGFSSNSNNEVPDLVAHDTNAHSHYTMYHPELSQGMQVYFMVTATNKAKLSTKKVIGPITIDTTAPEINGEVMLTSTTSALNVEWVTSDIVDNEDPDINTFIAIGHTESGTDLLPYKNTMLYQPTQDGTKTLISIPIETLIWSIHGDHVYYASLRVENSAGLSSVKTSRPYRYVKQLPNDGVVVDIERSQIGNKEMPRDIDVQPYSDSFAIRWSGFQHPHLDITYKVSVGSQPGQKDIVADTVAGDTSVYEFTGLNLESFKVFMPGSSRNQKYYANVMAETQAGSASISSDGVTILPENSLADGLDVFDGPRCVGSPGDSPWQTTHQNNVYVPTCKDDSTFQITTSVVDAHWTIQDNLKQFVTHVLWSLEEEISANNWIIVNDFKDIGLTDSTRQTIVFLKNGGHYRSVVKLCHTTICFDKKATNGFWVTANPPSSGTVNIVSTDTVGEDTRLRVGFQPYQHEFIVGRPDKDVVKYYWAIVDRKLENDLVYMTKWSAVSDEQITTNNGMMQLDAIFIGNLPRYSCLKFALRGYNEGGLSTTTFTDIFDCNNPEEVIPDIVIDAEQSVVLPENDGWLKSDVDFTHNTKAMYAVWPTLRNDVYEWALIEDTGAYQFKPIVAPKEPCHHPTVIKCGRTESNFANIDGVTLRHGKRYKVCVSANSTIKAHETWNQDIPAVSACSDGVVVDITPPTSGHVWIGWKEHNQYQVSTTEMAISMDSFIDVEELGNSIHHSGIKEYAIAIGSYPGESDIQDFQSVGICNSYTAKNLQLQNGHKYYTTVKATDFVGLSTSVISEPVTIDSTPPVKKQENFAVEGNNIWKSASLITASWNNVFVDLESGIDSYAWAVGSNPGHSDIQPFITTDKQRGTNENIVLQEGHSYYITVKATNKVGLVSVQSYGAYTVDASPPIQGHVYDGNPRLNTSEKNDQDFQTESTILHASWEGFHDPHTAIVGYWWHIGTCSECDNVLPVQYVGLQREVFADHLRLSSGLVYYTTIRACNSADLCSSVTSDGILIDDSPPDTGRVYDGPSGHDKRFQASRVSLSAHWWGFHDPQSGLSHYEWRAGTTKGGMDIFDATQLHLTDSSFKVLNNELPTGTIVFITIRAYNHAGLWTERSSNGILIDSTAPDVIKPPGPDATKGVIVGGSQVVRSFIALTWQFTDQESGIAEHYLSVQTDHDDDMNIPTVKIPGGAVDYTFTDLALHDGSRYTIGVMACNGASICTEYQTYTSEVDSSAPTTGYFAIQSEHAANLLHREIDGYMNWVIDGNGVMSVSLAWLGFSDCHSGISHYHLTLGTGYNGRDLIQDGLLRIEHGVNGMETEEGPVQKTTVALQTALSEHQVLYASLWAVNGVGLESSKAIGAFEILPNGILMLIRRCERISCDGHCVCASQDQLCPRGSCQSYTGDTVIDVVDVIDLMSETVEDIDYSPSKCIMAARWTPTGTDAVEWYEWSVGLKSVPGNEPSGVFDTTNERVWHGASMQQKAVFTLPRGRELSTRNTAYAFFVRAWFDADKYAVYRSDGTTPDVNPPQIKSTRAVRVKDVLSSGGGDDVDFTTNPNEIRVSWTNVFTDSSGIDYFRVSLGTIPEGEDIAMLKDHRVVGTSFTYEYTNLGLVSGRRYFSSVRAFNMAGLYSTQSSDGFVVDTKAPSTGIVYDGTALHDLEYQNSSSIIFASWHGFVDFESSIYNYEWCVGSSDAVDEFGILRCTSVGLQTSAAKKLDSPLTSGLKYFSKIIAVDSAGLRSNVAVSDGVVVDITPPQPVTVTSEGANLLQNPSYESQFTGWNILPNSKTQIIQVGAQDGVMMASVFGSISQSFSTRVGQSYEISFYVSHVVSSNVPLLNQEGYIEAPKLSEVFKLYNQPGHAHLLEEQEVTWLRHTFYFTASQEESQVKLSSVGESNGILIDNVKVQELRHSEEATTTTVKASAQFVLGWASIEAKWQFVDPESPIVDYQWAIGYVKGGIQLQTFQYVGTTTAAVNTNVKVDHGSKVTVTVMATNAAELTSVAYSDEIIIDQTPPVIKYVNDGSPQTDNEFVPLGDFAISWASEDSETGIEYCDYAIGSSPGASDVQPTTRHTFRASSLKINLSNPIQGGQKVFTTVRCFNGVMLQASATSNGVVLVSQPPSAESASVTVKNYGTSGYPVRDMYQSNTSQIRARWDGFTDPAGIAFYECSLSVPSVTDKRWMNCGSSAEHHVTFDRLDLQSGLSYSLFVRAVNNIGLQSGISQGVVNIDTSKPTITGTDLQVTWSDASKVTIAWNGVFTSSTQLVYEISIGTIQGGSDILQWVETLETTIEASPLQRATDYYMTLTAINAVGLYSSVQQVIVG